MQGRIEVYEVWGELQLLARTIELDKGAEDQETLSSLKARAQAEGWLDQDRKRALPRPPKMIGLITGAGSRARADVRGSLRKACVQSEVFVETVNMEAPDTAHQIRTALASLNERPEVDLIVIARGGGNKRVLWALNDWELARAIVHSRVPVMAAIGHWQDETLADLVAHARAHTPSLVGAVLAEEQIREPGPSPATPQGQTAERDPTLAIALIVGAAIVIIIVVARALGWI